MSFVSVVVKISFLMPIADTPWLPAAMLAAGCAMLAFFLLRRLRRRSGKPTRGGSGPAIEAQPRPQHEWDGAHKDTSARFDRQQVELYDLARDLTGQLDSKLVLLRQLIAQSDERIERLEELLSEFERRGDLK